MSNVQRVTSKEQSASLPMCYMCHQFGHTTRDYRQNIASLVCYACHQLGHLARDYEQSATLRSCYLCCQMGHLTRECEGEKSSFSGQQGWIQNPLFQARSRRGRWGQNLSVPEPT